MGRSTVTFEIDSTSNNHWVLAAKAGGVPIRTFDVSKNNVALTTGSAATSANTCATVPGDFDNSLDANFELAFGEKGNLESFTNGTTELVDGNPSFNGVRICVNANPAASVCVSPAGYAYAGNCDD
jgi:hypothetical protein